MSRARTRPASDTTLLGWLDDRPDRLERYLASNPGATDHVDDLTSLAEAIGPALEELTRPDEGLQARMTARLGAPASEVPMLIWDLMGLALRTASVLANPEPPSPGTRSTAGTDS